MELFFLPILTEIDSSVSSPSHSLISISQNSNFSLIEKTIRNATSNISSELNSVFQMDKEFLPTSITKTLPVNFVGIGDTNFVSTGEAKALMRNFYFDASLSPVLTNIRESSLLNYDVAEVGSGKASLPIVFQSKEEAVIPALLSTY